MQSEGIYGTRAGRGNQDAAKTTVDASQSNRESIAGSHSLHILLMYMVCPGGYSGLRKRQSNLFYVRFNCDKRLLNGGVNPL